MVGTLRADHAEPGAELPRRVGPGGARAPRAAAREHLPLAQARRPRRRVEQAACLRRPARGDAADVAPPPRGAPVPDDLRRGRPCHMPELIAFLTFVCAGALQQPKEGDDGGLTRDSSNDGYWARPRARRCSGGATPEPSTACRRRRARRRRSRGLTERPPKAALMGRGRSTCRAPALWARTTTTTPSGAPPVGALRRAALRRGERGARVAPADGGPGVDRGGVGVRLDERKDRARGCRRRGEEARRGFASSRGGLVAEPTWAGFGPRAAPYSPGEKEGSKFDRTRARRRSRRMARGRRRPR